MRLDIYVTILSLGGHAIASAISQSERSGASSGLLARDDEHVNELLKRKGGGGGGSRGGGGGSSSGSSGSSGSRSGGSSGSGSRSGSGAPRSFGGGKFYGGGSSTPYKAGSKSPKGIVPFFVVGAAALAIWPAVWLYGVYHYPYTHPYNFHNDTANQNQSLPVICGCDPYNPCSCDENDDSDYLQALVGDGNPKNFNQSLLSVADVNGTQTLLINGTLPNGTEAPEDNDSSSSAHGMRSHLEVVGWWPMVAVVVGAVFMV